MDDNVRHLSDLLTALDLEDVTLVGWSYGGATVMGLAMAGDERIRGLVLVGTGGPDSDDAMPPEPSTLMRMFYSKPALQWRRLVPPIGRGLMSALSDQAFSGKPQPEWWMQGLIANFSRWDTVLVYRSEMFAPIDADGFAPDRVSVPVRILHGDDDRLAPVGIGRYLAERIPGATYREVPGGSHMLPVTQPGLIVQEVAALGAADRWRGAARGHCPSCTRPARLLVSESPDDELTTLLERRGPIQGGQSFPSGRSIPAPYEGVAPPAVCIYALKEVISKRDLETPHADAFGPRVL